MDEKNYVTIGMHNEFADRMDSENKRLSDRLDIAEAMLNKFVVEQMTTMNGRIERMLIQIENLAKTQDDHRKRISKIEDRDGENWRKAVGYVITTLAGAFASFILMKFGLN